MRARDTITRYATHTSNEFNDFLSQTNHERPCAKKKHWDRTCAQRERRMLCGRLPNHEVRAPPVTHESSAAPTTRPEAQRHGDKSFAPQAGRGASNPRAHILKPGWSTEKGNERCSSNCAAPGQVNTQLRTARTHTHTLGIAAMLGRCAAPRLDAPTLIRAHNEECDEAFECPRDLLVDSGVRSQRFFLTA